VDNYESCVSHVNGIRITATQRTPGWLSTPDVDYCPDHAKSATLNGGPP
jgi:hypothetical protein